MIIKTPAKVILSGEHSVCYGAPAIGAPLALYLQSEWVPRSDKRLILEVGGVESILADSWSALAVPLAAYRQRYEEFCKGGLPIERVLPDPQDLVVLTLAVFEERFPVAVASGVEIRIKTDIHVSSGMGSSSALIINLLQGLLELSGLAMPEAETLVLARGIEDFQHGASSGLDLALVTARQALVFVREKGVIKVLSLALSGVTLIYSGRPQVSTGQCVSYVRERHGKDAALWNDFADCTRGIQSALAQGNADELKRGICGNQTLLEHIGVVPEKVRSFVSACARHGIPAKICGAGAVSGDAAGMIWVLANDDAVLESIVKDFGYTYGCYSFAS